MTGFDEALAQSIDALRDGASLDDCLARYPEHAAGLAPLLSLAAALSAAPRETMSTGGFDHQRERLRDALLARQATPPTPNGRVQEPLVLVPPQPRSRLMRATHLASRRVALIAAVLVLAVVLGLSGASLASAKAAPDAPLYPVKRAVESFVAALPADDATRTRRAIDTAETRLGESRAVCVTDPGRADALRDEMRAQRSVALMLLARQSGASAEALRARADALLVAEAESVRACRAAREQARPAGAASTVTPTATQTPTASATPSREAPTATRPPTVVPPTVTLPAVVLPAAPTQPADAPTEAPAATGDVTATAIAAAPRESDRREAAPRATATAERPREVAPDNTPAPPPPAPATQPPPPPPPATSTPAPPPPAPATQPPPPPPAPTSTPRLIENTKEPPRPATAQPASNPTSPPASNPTSRPPGPASTPAR